MTADGTAPAAASPHSPRPAPTLPADVQLLGTASSGTEPGLAVLVAAVLVRLR
ncbi:hypothetical protein [Haloterrigena alkaliphila]|uniref:Uncharacterized protein n=1 Tax=Haloterrigena alkaliphila TaxID=2816475 RepID=A0A8A2V7H1_9EURY|nr:hypothetical protein [Haloterrigena alkaliphila]QSW97839.1 hypothetical protein J0X25_10445 [Haloterrigena alkaliphila]